MPSQWAFANRTHCKRGHALSGENARPFPSGQVQCRACTNWRIRRYRHGQKAPRPVCPHGHPYTVETTYYQSGQRHCRVCRAFNDRKTYNTPGTYRSRSTRSVCYVAGCRDHTTDGLACVAHRAMLWVLDEEYRAYWRSLGQFEGRVTQEAGRYGRQCSGGGAPSADRAVAGSAPRGTLWPRPAYDQGGTGR